MRRFWARDYPVGCAFTDRLYDPATLTAYASYAAIAGAVVSGASTLGLLGDKGGGTSAPPPPPAAPPAPPTLQSPQVEQVGLEARRKAAAAGGIMANIATGPQGTTMPASITGKTLLGQ